MKRNRLAFERLALKARVLNDGSSVNLRRKLLGVDLRIPVLLTPIGSLQGFEQGGGLSAARAAESFIREFGLVPCRLTGACHGSPDLPSPVLTIFTSMFMHGGWFHILGNMWFLAVFGDNVEDAMGDVRFAAF